MAKQKKHTFGQVLLRLGFVVYVAAMVWLLFGQRWGEEFYRSVNLRPLVTIRLYWRLLHRESAYLVRHAFINLVGNVVMFIPLGFFQPYLFLKLRRWYKTLLCTIVLILVIECVQYLTGLGSCDVDDLILNTLGALLGYGLWRITNKTSRA
jgi:glycopeptide antibiotics resistance protein